MRDFFSRTSSDGDDQPVDLAQVRADDALIEALRQVPLFDEPTTVPTRWLRAVDDIGDDDSIDESGSAGNDGAGDDGIESDGGVDRERDDISVVVGDLSVVAGTPVGFRDPAEVEADAQVAALLRAWRNEIDAVPLPPPLDTAIAVAAIRNAPTRRRSVRPMIAVAAAIAGLLMGSTAIGARSAGPEDTLLWPVTQLLWGDRVAEVNASREARDGIDDASKAIDAGYPDQAEAALEHVTVVITKVEDPSVLATLRSDLGRVQSQLDSSRATSSSISSTPTTPAGSTGGPVTPTAVTSTPPSSTPSSASVPPVVPPVSDEQPPVTSEEAPATTEAPAETIPDVPVDVSSTDAPTTDGTPATSETPTTTTDDSATVGDEPATAVAPPANDPASAQVSTN